MNSSIPTMAIIGTMLFSIGLIGLLVRRNMLILLMCVELMLNGANLVLVTYSRLWTDQSGQILAFVVIAVAAAEVAIGFGIILSIFRRRDTLDVRRFNTLRY